MQYFSRQTVRFYHHSNYTSFYCAVFVSFERKQHTATKLVLIAVMVALSVVGRMLFFYVPGFKPVTAMVIITAIYFGGEAGFMTGALTALISNFFLAKVRGRLFKCLLGDL